MANTTVNLNIYRVGPEGHHIDMPVDGGSHLYKGSFVANLNSGGMAVPGSTASSGPALGVATHEVDASAVGDNIKNVRVETDRDFLFPCGTSGDAVTDATPKGTLLYMVDDHTVSTVSTSRQLAGIFQGMDASGMCRVHVSTKNVAIAAGLANPA